MRCSLLDATPHVSYRLDAVPLCCWHRVRRGGVGRPSPLSPSIQVLDANHLNPFIPVPQVLGFSKGPPAGSFAVPFSHSFSGGAVGAELSLAAQRHEYCEGHRRRRAAVAELMSEPMPPPVPAPSELLVHCGVFLPADSYGLYPPRLLLPLVPSASCRKSLLGCQRSQAKKLCLGWSFHVCYLPLWGGLVW